MKTALIHNIVPPPAPKIKFPILMCWKKEDKSKLEDSIIVCFMDNSTGICVQEGKEYKQNENREWQKEYMTNWVALNSKISQWEPLPPGYAVSLSND